MADDIDIANTLIENEVSYAIGQIRKNMGDHHYGCKYCTECGDDIPLGRQKLGFKRCVPCAEEIERKNQLFSG